MAAPAVMVPGQQFTKSWRVQNIGTCPWTSNYGLSFVYGNAPGASMGGQPVVLTQTVPAGATVDLTANLVAPIAPGVYQGVWQMHNAAGNAFGESLTVGIQVAGAPTPTPAPTQTPVPGIAFSASVENIQQGKPVTLTWDVQDAKAVYFYIAGQDWQDKAVEAGGSAADIPAATTTYQLRVVRDDGQEEVRSLTVYVEPAPELPQITYFAVAPAGQIILGQCLNLGWQINGDVAQVSLFRNKETIWESAPVEGALDDCPPQTGSYEYAVGVRGSGGINYRMLNVNVVAVNATPVPAAPAIDLFSVLPEQVELNGCVEAKWTVGGDVTSIRVLRDDVVLLDSAPQTGSGSDCLAEAGRHVYRLEATNDQGLQATMEAPITVGEPSSTPTPVPPAPATPAAAAPSAGAVAEIVGQELILISYRDATGSLTPPLTGTKITAKFEQDGRLSGFAGCNNYNSSYQVGEKQSLTIAPLATTLMSCQEPIGIMDQEAHYLNSLQTAAAYSAEVGQLTLHDGAGNPVVLFVAGQ
jgi:heat shock protein HslJ